jgi:hypothetical protein
MNAGSDTERKGRKGFAEGAEENQKNISQELA